MEIKILYFAHIRDITGKNEEYLNINSNKMDDIKNMLFNKYPEIKNERNLLFAVNNEYYNNSDIKEKDIIAIFPAVSGG